MNTETQDIKSFMDSIDKLIDKKIDERLECAAFIKSGTVTAISPDGLRASVKILGENTIITDIEVYNVRKINVNDTCQLVHWGSGGKRLNNVALVFGSSSFR